MTDLDGQIEEIKPEPCPFCGKLKDPRTICSCEVKDCYGQEWWKD